MRLAPVILLLGSTLGVALMPSTALAQARIFCCDDARGRKVCGDFLPPECSKRPYEERDDKGFVTSRKEAPLTPEQQARREAEDIRKAEAAQKKTEERRRNLALLSTYSDVREIDAARDRAITELQKHVVQAEKQVDTAQKSLTKAEKEKEFYKGKALPPEVRKQISLAEGELKAKRDVLDARKVDIEKTRVKFEAEKKKFSELKGIISPGPAIVPTLLPEDAPASPTAPNSPTAPTAPTAPAVPQAALK